MEPKIYELKWPERKTLLMSIKPAFVKKIYNGEKDVELRRVKPKIGPGDEVIIYETSPVYAITGIFQVKKLKSEHDPHKLYCYLNKNGYKTGLSYHDYHEYFLGARQAVGIFIQGLYRVKPIYIEKMREFGIEPPQSYRYIDKDSPLFKEIQRTRQYIYNPIQHIEVEFKYEE